MTAYVVSDVRFVSHVNEWSHLDVMRNTDPVITPSCDSGLIPVRFSIERALSGNILLDPESRSNTATALPQLKGKNKTQTNWLADEATISPRLYRDRTQAYRFRSEILGCVLVSCQLRSRKVREPLSFVVNDRMVERGLEGRVVEKRGRGSKKKSSSKANGKKKKERHKEEDKEEEGRPSIILQSGQDGRDSKLPVSRLTLRFGITYSFWR